MSNPCKSCTNREDCSPDEVEHCATRDYWHYEHYADEGARNMDIKIEPHKKGDAGMLCMPLVKNLPDADKVHKDWERTTCPVCGTECWVSDAHKKIIKTEPKVKAVCTMCALKGSRL